MKRFKSRRRNVIRIINGHNFSTGQIKDEYIIFCCENCGIEEYFKKSDWTILSAQKGVGKYIKSCEEIIMEKVLS